MTIASIRLINCLLHFAGRCTMQGVAVAMTLVRHHGGHGQRNLAIWILVVCHNDRVVLHLPSGVLTLHLAQLICRPFSADAFLLDLSACSVEEDFMWQDLLPGISRGDEFRSVISCVPIEVPTLPINTAASTGIRCHLNDDVQVLLQPVHDQLHIPRELNVYAWTVVPIWMLRVLRPVVVVSIDQPIEAEGVWYLGANVKSFATRPKPSDLPRTRFYGQCVAFQKWPTYCQAGNIRVCLRLGVRINHWLVPCLDKHLLALHQPIIARGKGRLSVLLHALL
mmetsp:Transcript_69223/g.129204  ORF Transcript_69223/g.129204 Transcript_69223/m.129204 type:complete len:280 (-) Transcript_69223:938-1777(-)